MTDHPRRSKDKDASTRFMRVEQLFGAQTVEVPAATLLARAAASEPKVAVATAGANSVATRRSEAPTTAMPIAHAKTHPAPTVLRRRLGNQPPARDAPERTPRPPSPAAPRVRRRVRPVARRAALALIAITVAGALLWSWTHLRARDVPAAPATTARPPVAVAVAATTTTAAPTAPAAADSAVEPAAAPVAREHEALPSTAADQLAAGDNAAALASYRELARLWPEEPVYALIAQVLERRLRERCPKDTTPGSAPCAR